MTEDDVYSLSVWQGKAGDIPVIISCWKMTKAERELFEKTGRIWLMNWGVTAPPVSLQVVSPFDQATIETEPENPDPNPT